MASRNIKGITIEIDGDTTKLESAIKKANTEIKTSSSNLKDVDKLLKLDPGNTELLTQKYKNLQTEISATKDKLQTLKEAQSQMSEADVGTEQYDALQREIEETEQKLKGLNKEMNEFGSVSAQKIAAAGEKVKSVGDSLSSTGTKLTAGVTVPIVTGAVAAVNAYGDVDKEFQLVKQTMGDTANTAEDFQALWDQMGESAKNSVYGMSDASGALLNFARQGFTAKQATDMLTPAMSLAAGTGTELDTVTAGLGNALKMFGADSSEAANYADILAKAQAQANTDTTQLFDAMSTAGPICKTVGWDVKDLATITDLFGNAGISGSEGANALKTGLARLAAPSNTASISMDKLGLSTGQTNAIFDDTGAMKSMPEVLENLRKGFSGLSEQETLEAASNIFGKNQMAKWLTLIQSAPSDVTGLRNALDDCTGSADNMANALMSGTGGTIEQLKSTFDVLTVTIGQAVAPVLVELMQHVIDVMNAFMDLDPATQKVILTVAGIAAAIGPVLIVVGKLLSSIGTVMTWVPKIVSAVKLVGTGIKALFGILAANPIVLVIAAIAALVAAFIYLWNTSESFRQFWIGLWEGIKTVVSTVVEAIKGFFTSFAETVTEVWSGITETISNAWNTVAETASNIWNGIVNAVSTAWETIKNVVSVGIQFLAELFSAALQILLLPWEFIWQNFGDELTTFWEGFKTTISTALDAIAGFFTTVWAGISTFLSTVWTGIQTVATTVWTAISTFFTTILTAIQTVFTTIWTAISTFLSTIWTGISTVATTIWTAISAFFITILTAIQTVFTTVWNAIKTFLTTILNAIKTVFTTVWNAIKTVVTNVLTNISNTIKSKLTAAKNTITNILGAIRDKFQSIWDKCKSIVSGAIEKIKGFMHFEWSLPHLKMPHFSISGNFSLNPPSVPHFSVSWYKKAMENGMILNSPTIFGASGGHLLAGGEAGPEAVVGVDSLRSMIADAVAGAGIGGGDFIFPIYIGQERIDTAVVKATQRANYKSGGH